MAQPFYATDVDETEQLVHDGMTRLHYGLFTNTGSAIAYVKFWRGSVASVDPSSDAPLFVIGVPAGATIPAWLGDVECATGCVIGATEEAGIGDTAPDADIIATVFYN